MSEATALIIGLIIIALMLIPLIVRIVVGAIKGIVKMALYIIAFCIICYALWWGYNAIGESQNKVKHVGNELVEKFNL